MASLVAKRKTLSNEHAPGIFFDSLNILSIIPNSMLLDFASVCGLNLGHDKHTSEDNIKHIRLTEASKIKAREAGGYTRS